MVRSPQIPAVRLLTVLACLFTMAAQAATPLGEMLQGALQRTPGAALADAQRNVADALQYKAEQVLAGAPNLNVKYQTDQIGDGPGYREWEGGIDLPLWLPGQSDSYADEADSVQQLADTMRDARALEVAGELRERLWSALLARADAAQARSARDAAKKLFSDVGRRVTAGELPRSDSLLAEKDLVQREEVLQQALNQAARAETLFTRFTGAELPIEPIIETPSRDQVIDTLHPRLRLLHGEVERARATRDRISNTARSGPNLWLGGKSARAARGDDYESSVGIELSMPFGGKAYNKTELAEAEAALTAAQVEYAQSRRALEDTLAGARLDTDRTAKAVTQTQRRRDLAEQSLALSRRAFELGETDLVRLLQAQADALSARHDHRVRKLEHAQTISRMNQALGVIPQ